MCRWVRPNQAGVFRRPGEGLTRPQTLRRWRKRSRLRLVEEEVEDAGGWLWHPLLQRGRALCGDRARRSTEREEVYRV
jgi:hypothetical protein